MTRASGMLTPTVLRGRCVFCGAGVPARDAAFLTHLGERRWCRDRYFDAWLVGLVPHVPG